MPRRTLVEPMMWPLLPAEGRLGEWMDGWSLVDGCLVTVFDSIEVDIFCDL